ncbi:MAG TPA: YdcF family protein [Candidatus Saccharimonadales bacterium]|nr:YdcF family protein [Candidatus Saccharimonadales bacterium]
MATLFFGLLKKLFLLALLVGIILFGLIVAIPQWLGPSGQLQKADAIVAISGGDTQARTNEAIRLQKEGWADNLIFSGAAKDPNSPSNAEVMRRGAIAAGVAPTSIDIEELATNTIGNATGTAKIINERHYKKIILVTSKYHQRRAGMEFQRLLESNVLIINHPAPHDRNWPAKSWWLHPSSLFLGIVETVKTTYVWVNYRVHGV